MFAPPKRPVPVFPLPDLVMFPDAELPLHVFELRYRTMVRDSGTVTQPPASVSVR